MKWMIKSSLVFYVVFFFLGCETLKKDKQRINIEQFKKIQISSTMKSEVKQLLGEPDEIKDGQWIYESEGSEKMWIDFQNNMVESVSMSIWDDDEVKSVESLLQNFSGRWTVLKEPMSNPHSGPSLCYLEDLDNGKRVRIGGYEKNVEYVAKWKPKKNQSSIKEYLYRNVGKEFCIASHCSKVTSPNEWKHNHCEWLEKMVAKMPGNIKNIELKSKKSNKNKGL